MSRPYSSSPALRLTVGRSDTRRILFALLALCGVAALYLIWSDGYRLLAVLLLPPAALCLWTLRSDALAGTTLEWQRGAWTLVSGRAHRPVRILPASTVLGSVLVVAWQDLSSGRRGRLWLFADSAPAQELRRLRVRLTLEPRGACARE